MKKQARPKSQLLFARRCVAIFVSRFNERMRKKSRRARKSNSSVVSKKSNGNYSFGGVWQDVPVPENLDLLNYPDDAFVFFDSLDWYLSRGCRVRVNFDETKHISSDALIYMLGQIQKHRILHGAQSVTGSYPRSRKIEHLLSESGFFGLLRVKPRKVPGRKPEGVRFLKYKTGTTLDSKSIPQVRNELFGDGFLVANRIKKDIYRALTEAMNNVCQHAYLRKSIRNRKLLNRWWLGAQYNAKANSFSLTFYDAGVGIPKTLPSKYGMELIYKVLSLLPNSVPNDGLVIKAAVEIGRTRTQKSNRGKGLMDLHRLIVQAQAGSLTIMSRRGRYRFADGVDTHWTHSLAFVEGTLIQWELPLDVTATLLESYAQNTLN